MHTVVTWQNIHNVHGGWLQTYDRKKNTKHKVGLQTRCHVTGKGYLQVPVEPAHIHSTRVPPVVFQRRVINDVNDRTHDCRWVTCYAVKQRFKPPWNATDIHNACTLITDVTSD